MWELDHDPVLPAGYRGLRGAVLLALKKAQPLTASELARRFGVSATALRRHLKQLEEDGVVAFRREVRGVGAPVFAYSLTPAGEGLFPRAYAATLLDALETVRELAGSEGVTAFFRRRWERITREAAPLLATLPFHERVQLVSELMRAHGYMSETCSPAPARGEGAPDETGAIALTSYNCPLRAVAERFSEPCDVEERYLAEVLDANVERLSRIVAGCNACTYRITPRRRASGARRQAAAYVPAPEAPHPASTQHAAAPAAAHLVTR